MGKFMYIVGALGGMIWLLYVVYSNAVPDEIAIAVGCFFIILYIVGFLFDLDHRLEKIEKKISRGEL